jgi:hypothetical protein
MGRFEIVSLCNEVPVLTDHARGLQAPRFMKRIQEPGKIALAFRCGSGISAQIKASLELLKLGLIFGQ